MKKQTIILLCILGIGLLLRIYQISYALPAVAHEEYSTIGRAWIMFTEHTLNPHWFSWPGFLIYIELFFLCLLNTLGTPDWITFVLLCRSLQAVIGVVTLFLVYSITKRVYTDRAAIIATVFVALFPAHILYSQIARPEVMITLFYLLELRLSLWYINKINGTYFVASGVLIGLSIATKYNGILIICIPLLLYIYQRFKKRIRISPYSLLVTGAVSCGVFLLTNPFILHERQTFIENMIFIKGHSSFVVLKQITQTAGILVHSLGVPLVLASLYGMYLSFIRRSHQKDFLILSALGSSAIIMFIWTPSIRLLLSFVVILLILAAKAIDEIWTVLQRKCNLCVFMEIFLLALFLLRFIFIYSSYVQQRNRVSVSKQVNEMLANCLRSDAKIYWGMDATLPMIKVGGYYIDTFGHLEPNYYYADYASFKNQNYDAIVLDQDHRSYLTDHTIDTNMTNFYTKMKDDYAETAFPWDRLDQAAVSAPFSQILIRDTETHGTMYVYLKRNIPCLKQ